MIVGIGVDLQPVAQMAASITRTAYLNKVFTPPEIALCQHPPRRMAERLAGKFAVKEAYMKAIGAGIRQGVWFTQIEVLNRETGAPYIVTYGEAKLLTEQLGVTACHVTLSHTEDIAIAFVVLEKETT